ncbi:MAG TPA: mandelate racemase/muconate lactonizing enzyme family protein [Bacteroidales bacterium]|nr:mandelate racemase/muconate lactonizing enzyme family protein [Bacteroidales bacterium]
MKTTLQRIHEQTKKSEQAEREALLTEISDPSTSNDRRNFLKKAALGGIALGGLMHLSIEDTIAQTTQRVSRSSSPSELRITDLRVAEKGNGNRFANRIIRIETNQGIYGIGDVRDGSDQRLALFLKSKIVGLNPCNVEMIFKVIKQYGFHGRQGVGVSAVETACWDLCGKALGVPVWQLLGGRYRDKVRLYADTPEHRDPAVQLEKLKNRFSVEGFTWLKMDLGIHQISHIPDTLVNTKHWEENGGGINNWYMGRSYADGGYLDYWKLDHPFTQVQITDKGIEEICKIVEGVRAVVGTEIPISVDHFGHFDMNQMIRLGRALDKYRLGWLEDCVPWYYTDQWRTITDAIETPTCTGEDIYMLGGLLGGFKNLIDAHAVDIVHPDMVSAGGILETKKIGDYAEEAGIPMALHTNSTPIAFMGMVHVAAATENFLCLEHHNVDVPNWEDIIKLTGSKPFIEKGYANVPLDAPGLGIDLNDDYLKSTLQKGSKYFDATPEWDSSGRTYDKLWI